MYRVALIMAAYIQPRVPMMLRLRNTSLDHVTIISCLDKLKGLPTRLPGTLLLLQSSSHPEAKVFLTYHLLLTSCRPRLVPRAQKTWCDMALPLQPPLLPSAPSQRSDLTSFLQCFEGSQRSPSFRALAASASAYVGNTSLPPQPVFLVNSCSSF